MELKAKILEVDSGDCSIVLHTDDAAELGVKSLDRVRVRDGKDSFIALVQTTEISLLKGSVALYERCWRPYDIRDNDTMTITATTRPASIEIIRRKMDGLELSGEEIRELVRDISERQLSDIELASYITAMYIRGMNIRETADLTRSMAEFGDMVDFDRPVFDFHSIGGLPGNKITLLVVPIVAAAGLLIPKTSSRAISSACGTADIVELFMNVSFSAAALRSIAEKTNGTIAWGGGFSMAPADDIIIKAEYPLSIDPDSQMIASIMSKKLAMGVDFLVIDIPVGPETKVHSPEDAKKLARQFVELGERVGIHVKCAITYGDQPLGYSIGPAVESIEAIRILEGYDHPISVIDKACSVSGMLLEMNGIADGEQKAREILASGAALAKFREIVEAQGGIKDISSDKLSPGRYSHEIRADKNGYLTYIKNKALVRIVRAAGSPNDKGAGVILNIKAGHPVKKGDVLFTIYADSEVKLRDAVDLTVKLAPMKIESIIIGLIPEETHIGKGL